MQRYKKKMKPPNKNEKIFSKYFQNKFGRIKNYSDICIALIKQG